MSDTPSLTLPDFQDQPLIDGIASLDGLTENAASEGAFASLPQTEAEQGKGPFYRSRIKTARSRLFLLGYLPNDRGGGVIGNRFRRAVTQFQEDCGIELKRDGLLGPKTWQALAELVSFEDDSNLDRWWPHQVVLERALRLRLSSLGYMVTTRDDINLGIQRFMANYNAYFAEGQPLQTVFGRQTYEAIFDLDGLIERIAKVPQAILDKPNLRPLLICVSKIELWLLGYDVKPDGIHLIYTPTPPRLQSDMQMPPDPRPPVPLPFLKNSLASAMQKFWIDLGKSRKEARDLAGNLDVSFFTQLHLADEDPAATPQDLADEILKKPAAVPGILSTLKNLGHRLWDGIKRAARWVANLIRRGIKAISSFAKTVGRLLYHTAINAFDKLRSFFQGFKLSLQLLFGKLLPGTDKKALVIEKRRDFDIMQAIDQNMNDRDMRKKVSLFTIVSKIFAQCSRIFKTLIQLILRVVRATITGFAGLVIALVKFLPKAKGLIQSLNYNDELIEELKSIRLNLDPQTVI